ncbi:hypothetical protein SBA4_2940014 [Candidatus Sulfopaludibacter sp. SbA4]|nr:hypothetical protein SBA4_2940014 [Candidatus Sulfopaludibacter sp. SbA4]
MTLLSLNNPTFVAVTTKQGTRNTLV